MKKSDLPRSNGLLDGDDRGRGTVVLAGDEPDLTVYPSGTFRKILSGMATVAALIAATYTVPALHWARPWTSEDPVLFWNLIGREFLGEGANAEAQAEHLAAVTELATPIAEDDAPIEDRQVVAKEPSEPDAKLPSVPSYEPHPDDGIPIPRSLELETSTDLDPFYARLMRTDVGYEGAVTRVIHWGDSAIANDHVSSSLRELMQRRFGDAGHGFHLLAKPNASYRHKGIRFSDGEAWSRCYIIKGCKQDGLYGLGGTTVWSAGGARTIFRTEEERAYGRKASRIELWYRTDARGGDVRVRVDDDDPVLTSTRAEDEHDAWVSIDVEDGPHRFEVRAQGGGRVRLYGVVIERDTLGVVWDGMAQLGAFTNRMLNFNAEHLRVQIEHRDPALLVFQFGGNDLLLSRRDISRFSDQFRQVLAMFRGKDSPPACLVVAPVDHGERKGGRIVSVDMMEPIIEAQREVALASGCAFFDTREAMGGDGSVARWRRANPPLISGDLSHLTEAGQAAVGKMIYLALMEGYRGYRQRLSDGEVAP